MSKRFLNGDVCKKFSFRIFSFFLVFKHDFIRCVDFTRIAASNTASDDDANYVTHIISYTDLLYIIVLIL